MKANQHGVLICRVCNQNKERRSQVYRGARGDYVLGRVIHRKMVEGVKKLPQSTLLPALPKARLRTPRGRSLFGRPYGEAIFSPITYHPHFQSPYFAALNLRLIGEGKPFLYQRDYLFNVLFCKIRKGVGANSFLYNIGNQESV